MTVFGAGVIGLELGSVYARLGTKVTILEYLNHITPGMDKEISNEFMKILKKIMIEPLSIKDQWKHVTIVGLVVFHQERTLLGKNKKSKNR